MNWRDGLADARAGLNGAVIGIPQEINYGLLAFAGLGVAFAVKGIFAAFAAAAIGTLLYWAAGAGRHQVVGPRPTLVVLLAGLVSALATTGLGPAEISALLFVEMICVGLLLLLAARVGLGHLFKYIPLPVLAGFTNGVAATLVVTAIPMILGAGLGGLSDWSWAHFQPGSLSVAALTVIVCLKPMRRGWLRMLPAVLQALAIAWVLHEVLDRFVPGQAGPTIAQLLGEVPTVSVLFEAWAWPTLTAPHFWIVFKFALAIAVAAALETLAVTVQVEADGSERSHGNHVLQRLGLMHLVLSPCLIPVAASIGRAIALSSAGSRTRSVAVYYSFFTLFGVAFAFDWMASLPLAAVAGVLIVVARNMVGETLHQSIAAWRGAVEALDRTRALGDLLVMLGVVAVTLAQGFIAGLSVGVVAAMALFIRDQSRSVVRQVQYGDLCRSLRIRAAASRAIQAEHGREIVIVEAEGALFFGSMESLIARLDELVGSARNLVLDVRRVIDIDQTACQLLRQVARRYRRQGCRLCFAHVTEGGLLQRLLQLRAVDIDIPRPDWYPDLDRALEAAEEALLQRHGLRHDDLLALPFAQSDLATGLDAQEQEILIGFLVRRQFARGDVLFHQGDAGDSLFVVLRGAVSIRFLKAGHSSTRLVAFGPGALLGEMALVTGAPRSADAVADEDSELLELDGAAFRRLQDAHPTISGQLLRRISALLSDRLRNTTGQLRQLLDT